MGQPRAGAPKSRAATGGQPSLNNLTLTKVKDCCPWDDDRGSALTGPFGGAGEHLEGVPKGHSPKTVYVFIKFC